MASYRLPSPLLVGTILTPTALSANVDNYNPDGLLNATIIRIDAGGAARDITGLQKPAANVQQVLWLVNISDGGTTETLTLKHDATSTAANRFYGPNAADLVLREWGMVMVFYDHTLSRWLCNGI